MWKTIIKILGVIESLVSAFKAIIKKAKEERLKDEIRKKDDNLTRDELDNLLR